VTKDGEPYLVMGAAGGSRIITAIVAVISRMVDHQASLPDALQLARVYPNDGTLLLENHPGTDWKNSYSEELTDEGFDIELINDKARFGRVHAIHYDAAKNQWIGAADPDWEGVVAAQKN